jgi:hypothetical protein
MTVSRAARSARCGAVRRASFTAAGSLTTDVSFTSAGTYTLQLSADDGELTASDTVVITVEAAPVLTQLDVTPSAVTLLVGDGRVFSASGLDQYGDAIAASVSWTATGGTIDQSGNYTAGASPGSFSVTATDGTVSGNASVTRSRRCWPSPTLRCRRARRVRTLVAMA